MTSNLLVLPGGHEPAAAAVRYADELARLHRSLRWGSLLAAIDGEPLVTLEGLGDGLTTVAVRTGQLPERYLRALYGFRLAEFLQTGLMDPELVYGRALAHEPLPKELGPESIHICTLSDEGQIVGYVSLQGGPDPAPCSLDDAGRRPFPVEAAHHVDVLAEFAEPGRTTHEVFEIKRLIRAGGLPKGMARARVPWHLIVGLSRTGLAVGDAIQVIVGDSGERGALRHLGWLGFDLKITEGTRPTIDRTQLMWPSYALPDDVRAKPFAAEVRQEPLLAHTEVVEQSLREYSGDDWLQYTVGQLVALIERRRGAEVAA